MTVAATLRGALRGTPLPRLEAQMLWCHVLGVSRAWLVAHDQDPLPADAVAAYRQAEARRLAGEPMAYIVGHREFMGHEFEVTPAVLIPRPETELLVERALAFLSDRPRASLLELGTGSGAIAVSIALARPDVAVCATDVSEAALALAMANAQRLGAKLEGRVGDWYGAVPDGRRFDLIVSNPPYIHATDPHLNQGDLRFEPASALTDGRDGLSAFHAVLAGAGRFLRLGGAVFVEHGWDQAAAVRQIFDGQGFREVETLKDLAGIDRCTGGKL